MKRRTAIWTLITLSLTTALISLNSCDSDQNRLHIEGMVHDPQLDIPVENAQVNLATKQMSNGTWSNTYTTIEETQSGTDGRFAFEFEFNYTTGYRLSLSKSNYYSVSSEFTENDFESDRFYSKQFEMTPKSYLEIHFRNDFPFDENDRISYHIVGWERTGDDCCTAGYQEFIGDDIDETTYCSVDGEKEYVLEYIITRNNNTQALTKTFYAKAFENQVIELFY